MLRFLWYILMTSNLRAAVAVIITRKLCNFLTQKYLNTRADVGVLAYGMCTPFFASTGLQNSN